MTNRERTAALFMFVFAATSLSAFAVNAKSEDPMSHRLTEIQVDIRSSSERDYESSD